jgi:hypothetical protein
MILPGKHLSPHRALIGVGAEILTELDRPQDVSELWDRVRKGRSGRSSTALGYDWFVLALTFLYSIHAVDEREGMIEAAKNKQ